MPSKYKIFDTSRLKLLPLSQRESLVNLSDLLEPGQVEEDFNHEALPILADRILTARSAGAAVVFMMGAHVIKDGLSRHVIDFIHRGLVNVVAMNGAGIIHDYELALIGATSEPVAKYIRTGQFGLWCETGNLNEIISKGAADGLGLGEAVGKEIAEGNYPHRDVSILAAGYQQDVPVTVHVGIGYDIIHAHPNFDASAVGQTSGRDFLIFARQIENLEGGVLLCFGSAVMAPEVFLKALSMARNVASQQGKQIAHFTTAVFDLVELPSDLSKTPPDTEPAYYYRPFKTILVRTVSDGGESFFIRGRHRKTIPALHREILKRLKQSG